MPVLSTAGAASIRAFGAFRPSTVAPPAGFISATGGTITTSGNYKYHTFTSSGTFSVSSVPSGRTIDFILVAGGGGAANQRGGGGGGVVVKTAQSVSSGSYSVSVGSGGTFATNDGTNGGNTTFAGLTALGGGGGVYNIGSPNIGRSGGSGGAGTDGGGSALQPTSSSGGFGHAGGTGGGGGGGSAGGANAGGDPYNDTSVTGNSYAGGGPLSTDGTYLGPSANTGEGGGYEDDTGTGYNGASGVFVVRYLYQ